MSTSDGVASLQSHAQHARLHTIPQQCHKGPELVRLLFVIATIAGMLAVSSVLPFSFELARVTDGRFIARGTQQIRCFNSTCHVAASNLHSAKAYE
jgi:hypothetical protein